MSDTPKRLTWEEIGANKDLLRNALHGIARMDCPGDHIVGARYDDNDGKECKDCDACWEPYLPEAAPTDKDDENKRLREAIRTALDTAEQNVDDPDTVLIDGLRAALEATR